MTAELSEVEQEYMAFLAQEREVDAGVVERDYLAIRPHLRELLRPLHLLFLPVYGQEHEADLIRSYRYHGAAHAYRFLMAEAGWPRYIAAAEALLAQLEGPPVVVDYGCGFGWASMAVATLCPQAQTYLVDVDALPLRFGLSRFVRRGYWCDYVMVTEGDPYPELPAHDLCIASEVMEHLKQPMRAYEHIHAALRVGGILTGVYRNHRRMPFHVSPDLSELRAALARDYEVLPEKNGYRRRA